MLFINNNTCRSVNPPSQGFPHPQPDDISTSYTYSTGHSPPWTHPSAHVPGDPVQRHPDPRGPSPSASALFSWHSLLFISVPPEFAAFDMVITLLAVAEILIASHTVFNIGILSTLALPTLVDSMFRARHHRRNHDRQHTECMTRRARRRRSPSSSHLRPEPCPPYSASTRSSPRASSAPVHIVSGVPATTPSQPSTSRPPSPTSKRTSPWASWQFGLDTLGTPMQEERDIFRPIDGCPPGTTPRHHPLGHEGAARPDLDIF